MAAIKPRRTRGSGASTTAAASSPPEGRIYQVEYASKAVERGSFAVGVLGPRGVALAAVRSAGLRSTPEPLLSPNWCERVHRVDERIWCVACGVVPDATTLLRALREFAAEHRKTWGEAPPVEVVAKQLSRHAQKLTQRAGGRPFGAAFLLAGFDDGSDAPRLFKTDPGGTYEACEAGGFATAGAAPDDVLDALDAADLADADGAALQRAACAAAFDAAVASPPQGRDGARASDVEVALTPPAAAFSRTTRSARSSTRAGSRARRPSSRKNVDGHQVHDQNPMVAGPE
ncbi:threonine-type endopeptidase [Aureococcus anophagefferens]|nr:threonine-type endopeptidase [Aureococcus anophagefferens]